MLPILRERRYTGSMTELFGKFLVGIGWLYLLSAPVTAIALMFDDQLPWFGALGIGVFTAAFGALLRLGGRRLVRRASFTGDTFEPDGDRVAAWFLLVGGVLCVVLFFVAMGERAYGPMATAASFAIALIAAAVQQFRDS